MRLGGFQKTSLSDFPGRVAAICFTQGCNLRCRYCHNPDLIPQEGHGPSWDEVFAFLSKRQGQLEGVVFTGGEPLMQDDLGERLREAQGLGYAVKLDTNGTWPERLKPILKSGVVDYVAMDLKSDATGWTALTGGQAYSKVVASLDILKKARVDLNMDFEVRVTFVPGFHQGDRLAAMAQLVEGCPCVILQPLSGFSQLDASFLSQYNPLAKTADTIYDFQQRLTRQGNLCVIR